MGVLVRRYKTRHLQQRVTDMVAYEAWCSKIGKYIGCQNKSREIPVERGNAGALESQYML